MEVPNGHYIFGTVKVGERGQIIIPKEARETFGIRAGAHSSSWATRNGASRSPSPTCWSATPAMSLI